MRGQQAVKYNLEGCLTDEGTPCSIPLSEIQDWETKSVLNKSQLLAVQKALTRDFVVIQGPPGTGKTYVGLKIADTLIKNAEIWQKHEVSNILVVCYTNHALDQFVEGLLLKGHEDIIRCGGRCRNDTVKEYTLQEKVKSDKRNRIVPPREFKNILRAIAESLREKEMLEVNLQNATELLKRIQRFALDGRILPYETLSRYLPEHLIEWFERYNDASANANIPFLEIYLGLYPVTLEMVGYVRKEQEIQNNPETALLQRNEEGMIRMTREEGDGEFVDVEGEAEELIDRWVVDQEEFAVEGGMLGQDADVDGMEDQQKVKLVDADGFQYVLPSKRERRDRARRFLTYAEPMTEDRIHEIIDPGTLDYEQRWMLYKYLIAQYMVNARDLLIEQGNAYDNKCTQIKELDQRKDEYHMRKSRVIAMTTTCAARYRQILARIKPQIIIIEEAAEVLEAHVITSLTAGAEHVILIGDHQQLKPKPTVYKLAKDYNLELSLFERMIRNGMDCHRLDIQHRMRPEIACLLKDIYPHLENHDSVIRYPDVLGVDTNLHFIHHTCSENENKELKSKSNEHEAKFIVALCRYLLLQGYSPNQITVLTLYTGQLLVLKGLMPRSEFQGVRVACVDNFQGEECEIVLLSLVRSNDDDIIGFAGEENRICVSLSRAKVGLFVIGNFRLLSEQSHMWNKVVKSVQNSGHIGETLHLFCRNHPERRIEAKTAEDFRDAPAGGCKEPCTFRLQCGHACEKACHPFDQQHEFIECLKKCEKSACDNGHQCRERCHFGTECKPCMVKITKVMPNCRHEQLVPCSVDPQDVDCKTKVERNLDCGHKKKIFCFIRDTKGIKCSEPCEKILDCSHKCDGNCSECHQGRVHKRCQKDCNRVLVCSHICKEKCSKECPPCREPCSISCLHSYCSGLCGEICFPCIEKCKWSCKHKKCKKLCHEICERGPCHKPCSRKIKKCGHPCIGLCGEKCPKLCRICEKDVVEAILFGSEDEPDARFIQLIDCDHVFEVQGLDRWMTEETEEDSSTIALKSCPTCRVPITRSFRYGNIIKKKMQDIEKVKQLLIEQRKDTTQHEALAKVCKSLGQITFKKSLNKCFNNFKDIRVSMSKKTEKLSDPRKNQLETVSENQVKLLERIAALVENVNKTLNESKLAQDVIKDVTEIMSILSLLTSMCLQNTISHQQVHDIDLEVYRLFLLNSTLSTLYGPFAAKVPQEQKNLLTVYLQLLRSGSRIVKSKLDDMGVIVEKVRKSCGMQPLTQDEKEMVIKAMGFTSGHWYKCPNGHVYAIGECGGAMQESKCPECRATIGGSRHQLAQGNAHAGDFDGSRYAAWSEAANLQNFDPDEINGL